MKSSPAAKKRPKSGSARTATTRESAAGVRAYIASVPTQSRRAFGQLRDAARAAAPAAVEMISYGIPTLKLDGRVLIYYAAWKGHLSMYPVTPGMRRAFSRELEEYQTAKGTVQFALDEPIPTGFVKRVVKVRVAELRASGKR